jgi:GntR family transcriptional repressor for pyruvate dehydrogenase complex
MRESIQRTKLCHDVAERMIERIRAGEWTPGVKLPSEPNLAMLFDVSRATIRSAVKILQNAGILRSVGGSGTYVQENAPIILEARELASVLSEPQNVYELVQARYVLEPQLCALAAKYATDKEIEELFSILREMENSQDRHVLMSCGYRFHQAVAEFSHNRVLYGFYQSIASQLRGLRVLDSLTLDMFLNGVEEHRAIAKAIKNRNGVLAKALLCDHLEKDYTAYLHKTENVL